MLNTENIVSTLTQNDIAKSLVSIFEDLPMELQYLLNEAQDRYMHLIDVTSGLFTQHDIDSDRLEYSNIYNNSKGVNCPIFNDNDCVFFMSEIYNLPKLLCRMQITNDFNWTAASGITQNPIDDINESCNELKKHIKDDDLLMETIDFLTHRIGNDSLLKQLGNLYYEMVAYYSNGNFRVYFFRRLLGCGVCTQTNR